MNVQHVFVSSNLQISGAALTHIVLLIIVHLEVEKSMPLERLIREDKSEEMTGNLRMESINQCHDQGDVGIIPNDQVYIAIYN